jgi:hypothetical protein
MRVAFAQPLDRDAHLAEDTEGRVVTNRQHRRRANGACQGRRQVIGVVRGDAQNCQEAPRLRAAARMLWGEAVRGQVLVDAECVPRARHRLADPRRPGHGAILPTAARCRRSARVN